MVDVVLRQHSPLAGMVAFKRNGMTIEEAPGFSLLQAAGDDKAMRKALGKLPSKVGMLVKSGDATIFRIAPHQFWILDGKVEPVAGCYLTPMSSARTRIAVSGARARDVLAALAPIDFHPAKFKAEHYVMTGIHHTPVMIHCVGADAFHVYAMRTFARAVWDFTVDAAEGVLLQA